MLECLSSVLKQLVISEVDVFRFVGDLQSVLGEQLQNIPLLYSGCPALSDVLSRVGIIANGSRGEVPTRELRDRFIFLVAKVFSTTAHIRPTALFLDDLHNAPPSYDPAPPSENSADSQSCSSLDIIGKLIAPPTRMVGN